METTPSIRVENLTRNYGAITAIKNVSFTVNRGEIVGFLGPNGAGKSTTMRILSGIMSATAGSAWVGGISVAQNPHEVKRRIGYMPENNPLPDDMRVVEYLRFRARLKGVPGRKLRATVEEVMETCDLARTARRKIIGTLSKGFRQRVGIADALLGNPEVIIMDEPTIGLDPHQIQGIRKLINNLRGRLTVVLSATFCQKSSAPATASSSSTADGSSPAAPAAACARNSCRAIDSNWRSKAAKTASPSY